ncbi:MAG: signal peptidase I [Planctomycetota bacterium]
MGGGGRSPRRLWRDNIEAVAMAIVMALLLKGFIVEAYKIPTGSMQPTLIGAEDLDVFDRILVDKLSFAMRDPKRWEVAVFRFPLDHSKSFVKRIVGIGPEQFRIHLGDLWHRRDGSAPWAILRRPRAVQEAVWKRLDTDAPETPSWTVTDGGRDWTIEGRSIRARGAGHARFRPAQGAILDRYADGYPEALAERVTPPRHVSSVNHVGDLRVDGIVRALPGAREVVIDLDEGTRRYRFTLPGPAADPETHPGVRELRRGPAPAAAPVEARAAAPWRLPPGERVRFGVQNMDDLLELEIDGRVVCAAEIASATSQSAGAALGVIGEGADLDELMVYRDIYYTADDMKDSAVTIPAGQYFMLGDNTQDSSDSREWAYAAFRARSAADGTNTVVRGIERRGENPRRVGSGREGGNLTRFVDEWGEVHWLSGDEMEMEEAVYAPFVPRRLILGRALAVFWPLDPRLDLYRLRWVN